MGKAKAKKEGQAPGEPDRPAGDALAKEKAPRKKMDPELKQRVAKFSRGQAAPLKGLKDRKLKGQLRHAERLAADATLAAAKVDGWLLPATAGSLEAEGMERTWRFAQEDIVREAESGAAAKAFDLSLPQLGPYSLAWTRSGRHLLLGGRRGHLALADWQRSHLLSEVQVRETTRDVCFLHNEQFFAAAQKKYVYIYDSRGTEIHCLKDHLCARRLEFLPHHFLLASVGKAGVLRYQDTSTGQVVAQTPTRLGTCDVLRQNPWNAVLALGHPAGTVTMWAPNMGRPLVKMLCHQGPVRCLAIDASGRHMASAGADGQVKVWDVRTFRPLHAYFSRAPATALDLSQRGLLAVGFGRRVNVWRDALTQKQQSPYMSHSVPAAVQALRFCPYEDVLGVGHADGFSTMLAPGAGEPNFDSRVADPFQGKKARREQEVHQLLDKLQPDMIVLDPGEIGQVRKVPRAVQEERQELAAAANEARIRGKLTRLGERTKMKGKNKPSRVHRKKQLVGAEERKGDLRQRVRQELGKKEAGAAAPVPAGVPRALHRFYRKGGAS